MWKVHVLYWLAIVGATAAIKLLGGPWPPAAEILVPIGWMAALASLIVTGAMVARLVERRQALKRRRAVGALDALNISSATSRAQFLEAARPFMLSSWSDEDALAVRLGDLCCAIRSHPASSMDFGQLHELREAARQQRDLEAWGTRWQPTEIRDLFPELGPGTRSTAAAGGILGSGGLLAGAILVGMTAGPPPDRSVPAPVPNGRPRSLFRGRLAEDSRAVRPHAQLSGRSGQRREVSRTSTA